jgi:hypothetical protein
MQCAVRFPPTGFLCTPHPYSTVVRAQGLTCAGTAPACPLRAWRSAAPHPPPAAWPPEWQVNAHRQGGSSGNIIMSQKRRLSCAAPGTGVRLPRVPGPPGRQCGLHRARQPDARRLTHSLQAGRQAQSAYDGLSKAFKPHYSQWPSQCRQSRPGLQACDCIPVVDMSRKARRSRTFSLTCAATSAHACATSCPWASRAAIIWHSTAQVHVAWPVAAARMVLAHRQLHTWSRLMGCAPLLWAVGLGSDRAAAATWPTSFWNSSLRATKSVSLFNSTTTAQGQQAGQCCAMSGQRAAESARLHTSILATRGCQAAH